MQKSLQGKPTADNYTELGIRFGKRKQYDCANQAFVAALKIQPDSAYTEFMLGLTLSSAGQTREAIAHLQQSERLGFRDINLYLVLGAAFDQIHQTREAESEWTSALAIDPESAEALDSLAGDLIVDNDYQATISLLENPMVSGQRTPIQSLDLGLAYARTGKLEEASKVLRDGVNSSPDSVTLADELAMVLKLLGRSGEATAAVDLALERHPGDLNTELLCLRTLMAIDTEKASQLSQRLLQDSPHNWEVLYLRGTLEAKDGKLQPARGHLDESVTLNPDYALSQYVLGLVLAQLKDMAAAKQHMERAIALGYANPDAEENLAKVLQSLANTK